jgi:chromosome segregation ATPase
MPFSLDTYIAELERAEAAYKTHFGALSVLTHDKWAMIERFFETVVSKSREIFSSAERDAEAWVRSLLPPLEVQVREQRAQLKKRAENVSRIREAQETLDQRIGDLEEALEDVQGQLAQLKEHAARPRQLAGSEDIPAAAPLPRSAESDVASYLRVEI